MLGRCCQSRVLVKIEAAHAESGREESYTHVIKHINIAKDGEQSGSEYVSKILPSVPVFCSAVHVQQMETQADSGRNHTRWVRPLAPISRILPLISVFSLTVHVQQNRTQVKYGKNGWATLSIPTTPHFVQGFSLRRTCSLARQKLHKAHILR